MNSEASAGSTVADVRLESYDVSGAIGHPSPRISWRTVTAERGWLQTAYEVGCVRADGTIVTSGVVSCDRSIHLPWPFAALASRERVSISVRVWGRGEDAETESEWSKPVSVEAGLLRAGDWRARKVGATWPIDETTAGAAFHVRGRFEAPADIVRAMLYITAHGVFTAELNGHRVGDEVLAPGWTDYTKRLRYRGHDVTALVRPGANVLGATVADGWYRGRFGFDHGARNIYGRDAGLLAQIELTTAAGDTLVIGSDASWRWAPSAITFSNLYDGETCDLRLHRPRFSSPEDTSTGWAPVAVLPLNVDTLEAAEGPPVRRIECLEAHVVSRAGLRSIWDVGQNLAGRLRIAVRGPAGASVTIRHAEVLENGELALRPLRLAKATDRLVLGCDGVIEWEPEFTVHGFRYASIECSVPEEGDEPVEVLSVHAVVLHSDMRATAEFSSSNALLNRLHENIRWGMRSNFLDIPTDCPQRDERLGWTGDINVFAPTATTLFDCQALLRSWLRDLSAAQVERGAPPMFVPAIIHQTQAVGMWGDATVGVPLALFDRYADLQQVRDSYPGMCAWIDFIEQRLEPGGLWMQDRQLGDWLDPTAPADRPDLGATDPYFVANCYAMRSARQVGAVARMLGDSQAGERFERLAERMLSGLRAEYVAPSGRIASDSQTAYALAIMFDVYETPAQRSHGGRRLAYLVQNNGYRIGSGFVGTAFIPDALVATGHSAEAYALLLAEECPSFLYPLRMGATTIWERWDSMLPDGRVNPGEMTSFNHYALGSIGDWLHRTVAGLAFASPGGRRLLIAPVPGGDLTAACSRQETTYGMAEASWALAGGIFTLTVLVPPNCTATVRLPDGSAAIEVASGRYDFACTLAPVFPPVSLLPPSLERMTIISV